MANRDHPSGIRGDFFEGYLGMPGERDAENIETCDHCGKDFHYEASGDEDVDAPILCRSCHVARQERSEQTETEETVEGWLAGAILEVEPNAVVDTFAEAGVLTKNRGLVLRTLDGSEFQITIVRSR